MKKYTFGILLLVHTVFLTTVFGNIRKSPESLSKISTKHLSSLITHVAPQLKSTTVQQYAKAIERAAKKYGIDPTLLIAIANRESSFRNDLPEGAAGELGICQIRKDWLQNSQFRAEFKNVTERDLKNPVKNFLYASWILQEIKLRMEKRTLPYWSYYNSVQFTARKRYVATVSQTLNTLKKAKTRELAHAKAAIKKSATIYTKTLKKELKQITKEAANQDSIFLGIRQ